MLADFGVHTDQALSAPQGGTCTPDFFPPEILAGGPPSRAVDVWAAGTVVWRLLAGSMPPAVSDLVACKIAALEQWPGRLFSRTTDYCGNASNGAGFRKPSISGPGCTVASRQ